MASANLVPAKLTLALQNCFDAKILRVDEINKRLFLRPLDLENEFKTLSNRLENCELIAVPYGAIKISRKLFLMSCGFTFNDIVVFGIVAVTRLLYVIFF